MICWSLISGFHWYVRVIPSLFGCAVVCRFALGFREAADIAAQTLKAVEHVGGRGGDWRSAQYMELITPETRGQMATPADLTTMLTESSSAFNLAPGAGSGGLW